MVVKAGYKQTDAGVIPEDWDVKTITNFSPLQRGFDLPIYQYKPGPFPVVYSNGILRKHVKAMVKGPGVVTGRSGTIGKIQFIENDYWPHNTTLWVTNFKGNIPKFVYYLYQRIGFDRFSSGSGVPTLNRNDVHTFRIAIPPPSEQRTIATALSEADLHISSMEQVIAKKRDIKQAAMQELLTGIRRLNGFKDEWEKISFADLADENIKWSIIGGPFGSNLIASDYVAEGVRIIQLQNIGDGIFHDDYAIYTTEKKADELLSCNIYPGEIILSKMGDPVARACFVPKNDRRYIMASDGIRLVVDEKCHDKKFVHDYINSENFRKKAIEASTGSTRQRIGLGDLKQLPLVVPSRLEQRAIATVLSDMDAELTALEQQRDKMKNIKQGMMQELLTGRIRLL